MIRRPAAEEFRDGPAIAALRESGELIADATQNARQDSVMRARMLAMESPSEKTQS